MREKNKNQCKQCMRIKMRISAGRFPNKKDTRYVDENGKMWSGQLCPECHKLRMAAYMKTKRSRIEENTKNPDIIPST